jgi:hypothetical protein
VKRLIAVLALAVLAFPAGALAMPDDWRGREHGLSSSSLGVAPVQRQSDQGGAALAPHLPAIGTDVAARDQQSPEVASASVSTSGGSDFDWDAAVIGAGGAICLLAVALAAGLTFRRRRVRRTSVLAG